MPIYAFECAACGHSFDRLQRLSDIDPSHCPECAAEAIRRQLTAPQFRLAGGGWYETDFKQAGDRQRNLAGDGGASKSSEPGSAAPKPAETSGSEPVAKPAGKADTAPAKAEPTRKTEPKPAAGTTS